MQLKSTGVALFGAEEGRNNADTSNGTFFLFFFSSFFSSCFFSFSFCFRFVFVLFTCSFFLGPRLIQFQGKRGFLGKRLKPVGASITLGGAYLLDTGKHGKLCIPQITNR